MTYTSLQSGHKLESEQQGVVNVYAHVNDPETIDRGAIYRDSDNNRYLLVEVKNIKNKLYSLTFMQVAEGE
jgi:hypothetical protein